MSQALTFIWGQPPSAKSQGLLETLCCLLPQPQPLSWSRCTRTTPHLMGGWKGRRQGREENLQVNILNIYPATWGSPTFCPQCPLFYSAHVAPVSSLPPHSITILPPKNFSIFLPPLQLWYPIPVPVLSSLTRVLLCLPVH